ncbi:TIGR01458 family HAD-type hydrolase [Methyloceanibacter sp.]|uniref:TIGR01458 family HAD-type hydrolase n=1 Tax=Methyloceanibacter sp. TaxID=1965321 RepID=UPI002C091E82|nr:TIGR01458 family HAD-type hydrolase [Methyloceanibacter sp.]HML93697.1 TIGR01458 family HAD-type hydrolase [Methyloceanibacter sp.]
MIRGVVLDLAGVVYEGDHVLPGALEAIAELREAGLPIRFVTNTTTKTKQALLARLNAFGLDMTDDELFTPGQAALQWLADHDASPVLLVHPNLEEEFADIPARGTRAVVVGDAGDAFTYANMNQAFRALIDGASFLALAKNRIFKSDDGQLSLDAGAFVTALEYACGEDAIVLGKPSPDFFDAALESMDCAPEDAVMVGDDAESDVAGALKAGLSNAVLVRTGKYRDGDEDRFDPPPTAVADDLAGAVAWILVHS